MGSSRGASCPTLAASQGLGVAASCSVGPTPCVSSASDLCGRFSTTPIRALAGPQVEARCWRSQASTTLSAEPLRHVRMVRGDLPETFAMSASVSPINSGTLGTPESAQCSGDVISGRCVVHYWLDFLAGYHTCVTPFEIPIRRSASRDRKAWRRSFSIGICSLDQDLIRTTISTSPSLLGFLHSLSDDLLVLINENRILCQVKTTLHTYFTILING